VATAPTDMATALHRLSADHLVYGADYGVPCSTEHTMEANKKQVLEFEELTIDQRQTIGGNVLSLFPFAAGTLGAAPSKLGNGHKNLQRDRVGA